MRFLVFSLLFLVSQAAPPYVWDLIKPPPKSDEVLDILINAVPGETFPLYAEIPETNFDCSAQKFSGYYADVSTRCQVFHRCDLEGVRTSYLCPNSTVFDQIRLVCDYFFNVDCQRGSQYVDFANSRFYTNLELFDTPPADYVVPWEREAAGASGRVLVPSSAVTSPPRVTPARPVTTTTEPVEEEPEEQPTTPVAGPRVPVGQSGQGGRPGGRITAGGSASSSSRGTFKK